MSSRSPGAEGARVRCFYDADEEIELWGKYLAEELPAIDGRQAAAVVVFVSADCAALADAQQRYYYADVIGDLHA
jgi:hypothetical protein